MSSFTQAAVALPPAQDASWLQPINELGRERWQALPFPTRKSEHWKYTSLRMLEDGDYLHWPQTVADTSELEGAVDIAGLDACRLVFVNGFYSEDLSSGALPAGVELVRFAEADEAQVERISALLSDIVDSSQHPFAALNEYWLADGLFICVKADTRVETPIQISHITTAQARAFTVQQRLLMQLESGAEACLVEHFSSSDEVQNCFSNGVTEIQLGDNARLTHYRLHVEEEHALHIGGMHVNLGRDAVLDSFQLAMGSALQRTDVVVHHRGNGAHCELKGVYLPRNEQLVDFHTTIEHREAHCTTQEVFRGIIGDSARAVFNGRILIHPGAQKTRAELSNKNLLTSRDAEVDTKPELEIYADDVQCAHGATVARLDEKSMYYLRTRGISQQEAEVMLSFGFINELLVDLKHAAITQLLKPLLGQRFARDESLLRHIA